MLNRFLARAVDRTVKDGAESEPLFKNFKFKPNLPPYTLWGFGVLGFWGFVEAYLAH